MTDKFLEQAKYLEQLKQKVEETEAALLVTMQTMGVGATLQDPETMAVYKIVEPRGTFVPYKKIDYVRTALEGERAGSLSKKEAEALGFTLKK